MNSQDNAELLSAARRADHQSGSRPFAVNMERIGPIR